MNRIRIKWTLIVGWLAVLGAITGMLSTWMNGSDSGARTGNPSRTRETNPPARGTTGSFDQVANPELGKARKPRIQPDTDLVADTRLRSLLADGDLNAIHEELTKMADARRLASVAGLLKVWCSEGSLEIAQWCLVISEECDPDLNLKLSAEALSNPSEVIRIWAAAKLEEVSEIQFENSLQANDWLESRSKR